MKKVTGIKQSGHSYFSVRMKKHADVFQNATGEPLFPGTINIKIAEKIPIKEHFRVPGTAVGEPEEDFLFEICRLSGKWAYRIRPLLKAGGGGHGDDVIEIACRDEIEGLKDGVTLEIEFFV